MLKPQEREKLKYDVFIPNESSISFSRVFSVECKSCVCVYVLDKKR